MCIRDRDKAERLAGEIRRTTHNFTVEVEACKDQVGGGSAPTVLLDGYAEMCIRDRFSPVRNS